jgi:hypothetical protein
VRPEQLVQRGAGLPEGEGRPRIRDRRLDLAAVPDDRGVGQEPLDVALAEAGDDFRVESLEGGPKTLALPQNRQPREPGLEALQAEPLVDPTLARDRPAPFVVVVGLVERVGRLPATDQVSTTSTRTTPSSTVTG